MLINDVVQELPEAAGVFMKFGLHCVGCHISKVESIQQGAAGHGIVKDDLDVLVRELNDLIKTKEPKKK